MPETILDTDTIAQKIGAVETASDFLKRRAGEATPADMLPFLDQAKRETPPVGDDIAPGEQR